MISELKLLKPILHSQEEQDEEDEEIVTKVKRSIGNGPTRSRNLWSKKSSELYSLMSPIVSNHRPIFMTLNNLQQDTYIGVINTFLLSPSNQGTLERLHSNWSYFNKSFILSKVLYLVL